MKINFGPYPHSCIRSKLFTKFSSKRNPFEEAETKWQHFLEKLDNFLNRNILHHFDFLFSNRERKMEIRVDDYDVWSADYTLASIIVPVLKKLKEKKNGIPFILQEDVPSHIGVNCDGYSEEAWNWILDEMIWAFEFSIKEKDDSEFIEDNLDYLQYTMNRERATRGRILFAKYFHSLWD